MTSVEVDVQFDRGRFALNVRCALSAPVTGLFGPSGAGKSTLINLIAGLDRADRGRIAIGGEVLFDAAGNVNVPAHRRRIGVVFQEHRLFPHLTVAGNLQYGWKRCAAGRRRFSFDEIVSLLELTPFTNQRVNDLSGGERQRVALGRALLSSPRLLLLDEPLASLDWRLRQQIIPFLVRVRDELRIPMVLASHDLAEILQLTSNLLVLRDGMVAAHGEYAELVAGAAVIEDDEVINVLQLRVTGQVPQDGNTVFALGAARGGRVVLGPSIAGAAGEGVIATLAPSDIALAAGVVPAVSIQNQIEGEVIRIAGRAGHALVEVDIGAPVLARISLKSADALGIRPGRRVWCLFKSNALQYRCTGVAERVLSPDGLSTR